MARFGTKRWTIAVAGAALVGTIVVVREAGAGGDPDIAAGKALYAQNCTTCHGTTGTGDGPGAAGLPKKPASFAEPAAAVHTDEWRVRVVTEGGAAMGLSPRMPAFNDGLSAKQIQDVVTYVRKELSGPKT